MNDIRRILVGAVAAVSAGAGVVGVSTALAPPADAVTNCGTYTRTTASQTNTKTLVIVSGNISCRQARLVFDDMYAGKGTRLNRQQSAIGKYVCTGNSGGAVDQTGVNSYYTAPGIRIELRV